MTTYQNGRLQIATAALCCFCAGSLYGWSALIPVVEVTLTKSTGQAGLIFSLAIISFTLAVFATPRFPQPLQQLSGCAIFAISGAVSLTLASLSNSYLMFVLLFSIGFGVASGAIYINALSIASASKYPKISTPVVVASFGLGGALFGPVWRLLAAQGWDMSALLPAATALALSGLFAIWSHNHWSTPPSRTDSAVLDAPAVHPLSTTSTFLIAMICLTFGLGSMAGLMVLGLASKIIDAAGGTVMLSTVAIAGVAIGNTSGRLVVSVITLRYTSIQSVISATIVISIGLILIAAGPDVGSGTAMVFSGLAIVAFGYGIMASAVPTLVRSTFAEAHFARLYSIVFLAWGLAGLTAPWIAGTIFDRIGSFQPAVIGALLLTVCALFIAIIIKMQLQAGPQRY